MRMFHVSNTSNEKDPANVIIEPILFIREHPHAGFKVARSVFDTMWYFTDRNLQELPLGPNNVSFKIVDRIKDGEIRGKGDLIVFDKDPETKDLAYVNGIKPVKIEVFKEYKKGDPCIFNMKNIPRYAIDDNDGCIYCNSLTIDHKHPMYNKYSGDSIMCFHLKKGELKEDVISVRIKPDNSFDDKREFYMGCGCIVMKPGDTIVSEVPSCSIFGSSDGCIFDIHYDGTDITATKHFGDKLVFDLTRYDEHVKFDKSLDRFEKKEVVYRHNVFRRYYHEH